MVISDALNPSFQSPQAQPQPAANSGVYVRNSRLNNRYFTQDSNSFATVIGQGPSQSSSSTQRSCSASQNNSNNNSFFAQAIGQDPSPRSIIQLSRTDKAQRILEIHNNPAMPLHHTSVAATKRVRSPSTAHTPPPVSNSKQRHIHGLLNLANNVSARSRADHSMPPELLAAQQQMPRSLSVNFLYHKRAGDLRRQNNADVITCANNRPMHQTPPPNTIPMHSPNSRAAAASFTTEDIEDIYMPRRLDQFERKVKASQDQAENSEQEEARLRQQATMGQVKRRSKSRSNSKRIRRLGHDENHTKFIINLRSADSGN